MEFLTRDLRFAARTLFRDRGFLLLVVGAIALGVGANTTVFSVLNTLVFKPLPFPQAERLLFLDERAPQGGTTEWMSTSYLDLLDWRAQSRTLEGLAGFQDAAFDLSARGGGEAERVSGAVVTDDLFSVLRVQPVVGRAFTPDEGKPGAAPVALLGHGVWTRRFGADPRVVGRTLVVDGNAVQVVGVMPPGFRFPEYAELWVPLRLDPARARRDARSLAVVGRLAPGATLEAARTEMLTINWRLAEAHPRTNDGVTVVVDRLHDTLRGPTTRAAVLFQGITLLVLLTAWANVASLLLARAVARRREVAVRAALGATRGRLLRQLVAEGVVLAALGAAAGAALGWIGRNLLVAAIPIQLPFWVRFDFDARVLAFVVGITLAGTLLFALAPALQLRGVDVNEALKDTGGRGGTDARGGRLQGGLVVAEVALAVVLLVSAGLLVRSLVRLQGTDPGFRAEGVATARLALSPARYPTPERQRALWEGLVERSAALPGVEAAAAASDLPLAGGSRGVPVAVEGRPTSEGEPLPVALASTVTGDFFRVLGIPLRGGRGFDGTERAGGAAVVVVNRAMAERFWPGESAVGRRLRLGAEPGAPLREVVGVVGDVHDARLPDPTWPAVYVPAAQGALPFGRLVVRMRSGDPADVVPGVRAALRAIDPDLSLDQAWTMDEVAVRSLWLSRLYAWLAGVFAVVALGLSALGMYGLLSYAVRQRTQEIGIRAALGAAPAAVTALFVRRGLRLAALAVALGLPAAFVLARLLASLLFGVGAADPAVFVAAPLLVLGVALLASFAPAHAASRVEPSVALRHD